MGQYLITIIGQGPHHNSPENSGSDADNHAAKLVAELKARGHKILEASFIRLAEGGLRDNLETDGS